MNLSAENAAVSLSALSSEAMKRSPVLTVTTREWSDLCQHAVLRAAGPTHPLPVHRAAQAVRATTAAVATECFGSQVENRVQRGCVIIGKIMRIGIFVIPGLTRNPVHFHSVVLLDAGRRSRLQRGSSPA